MDKKIGKVIIEVGAEYRVFILFFPFASYRRVEDVSIVKVLGITVYARAGDMRSLFGFAWRKKDCANAA